MMKYFLCLLLCSLALGSAMDLHAMTYDEDIDLGDELEKTFVKAIQDKLQQVSQEDLDQLNSMDVKYEPETNPGTGLDCVKFTLTGANNCVATIKSPRLTDAFIGIFGELSQIGEPSELPTAMMKPFLASPCACEPISVSEGCNDIMKIIFGITQIYCDA